MQAVANDYCKTKGVNSCAIELADLPFSDNAICYGEYVPSQSKILINRQVFDMLEDFKYCKNQYLPMKVLSTVVHEAQHRVQFETLDKPNKSVREQLVSDSINQEKREISHNKYLIEPEELDARDATIEYIKECARNSDNPIFAKYLNTLIMNERKNRKSNAPDYIKQHFINIYAEYDLVRGYNLGSEQREFKNTVQQKLIEGQEKTRI